MYGDPMNPINVSPFRIFIPIVVLVAVLLPGKVLAGSRGAEYPLPKPKTTKIEIPGSLGGISIGQTKSETVKQWGKKGVCKGDFCHWGPSNYPYKGGASISFKDGEVSSAGIRWIPSFRDGKRSIRRSITKFHTAEGIRLKSTLKEAKKAYPDEKLIDTGGHNRAFKFETGEATMYIFVGARFVERVSIFPPGFSFAGEGA